MKKWLLMTGGAEAMESRGGIENEAIAALGGLLPFTLDTFFETH